MKTSWLEILRDRRVLIMVLYNFVKVVARGAMVWWLERSLVKQKDLGSVAAQAKCFSSLLGYKEVRIKWIQTG